MAAQERLAQLEPAVAELAAEAERLATRLAERLGSDQDAVALGRRSAEAARAYAEARRALEQQLAGVRSAEAAAEQARSAADEAGFDHLDDALEAALPEDEITRREAAAHARALARDRARSVVEAATDEVHAAADGDELPDPEVLRQRADEAQVRCRAASTLAQVASQRAERLDSLVGTLSTTLEAWAPVRADWQAAHDLATCAEGKGADNALQMRLSAYVLAARLGQVVAAANERLGRMAEQRYQLEHTAFRGRGERRGGLSLRIVDSWTGDVRDPATLSGGETFVVSLALALGLADVVTQEAGGAEIETLFVDEGFGSLDEDTLDRVMDCLDELRAGGRCVGIVSHVAELRDRVPDQLRVVKGRRGSSISRVRAAAPV